MRSVDWILLQSDFLIFIVQHLFLKSFALKSFDYLLFCVKDFSRHKWPSKTNATLILASIDHKRLTPHLKPCLVELMTFQIINDP